MLPITHLDGRALQDRFDSLGDHVNVGLPLGWGVWQVRVRGLQGAEMRRAHQVMPRWHTNPIASPSPRCAPPQSLLLSATLISPEKSRTAREGEMRAGGMNVLANCFSPFNLTLEKIKHLLLRAIPETFPGN